MLPVKIGALAVVGLTLALVGYALSHQGGFRLLGMPPGWVAGFALGVSIAAGTGAIAIFVSSLRLS